MYVAFSLDVTEWFFLEAIDTLKFPALWDISDFQQVHDHLNLTATISSTASLLRSRQRSNALDHRLNASRAPHACRPYRAVSDMHLLQVDGLTAVSLAFTPNDPAALI